MQIPAYLSVIINFYNIIIYSSIYLYIYISIYLYSIHTYIYLSIYLSIYISILRHLRTHNRADVVDNRDPTEDRNSTRSISTESEGVSVPLSEGRVFRYTVTLKKMYLLSSGQIENQKFIWHQVCKIWFKPICCFKLKRTFFYLFCFRDFTEGPRLAWDTGIKQENR